MVEIHNHKGQEEAGERHSLEHVMEEGMRPYSAPALESLFGLYLEPCAFLLGHNTEHCRISHPLESVCTDKTGALSPHLQQFALNFRKHGAAFPPRH